MKIGTRLKNTRKFLGLTQLEFSGGIVTESFYSRVENGKSDISMSKLIELLNYNQVSLYDFFEPAFQGNIEHQVILAFLDKDIDRLRQYKPLNDHEESLIEMLLVILGGGKSGTYIPSHENFIREYLNKNKDKNFFAWCILAYLSNIDELPEIVDRVVINLVQGQDELSLRILVNTLLTCLRRLYQANRLVEARVTATLIENIPQNSSIILEKLVAKYYLDLLNENEQDARDIVEFLKETGYEKFLYFDNISS